jgi:hypothetical protein
MKKAVSCSIVFLIILSSTLMIVPNVSGCHKFIVTCEVTEQDIVSPTTWSVSYDINIELKAGCSNEFWIGFAVSEPASKFHCNLYQKGDSDKTSINWSGKPSNGDHLAWTGWISLGSTSLNYYKAILDVWCNPNTDEGSQTEIIVDAWSTDDKEDIYHHMVTTLTTVHIASGIKMYHTEPQKSIQYQDIDEWVEYKITIEDMIGTAYGDIDLSNHNQLFVGSGTNWESEFPSEVTIEEPYGTAEFTVKVKTPKDGEEGDYAYFYIKGEHQENSSFNHVVWTKTGIYILKPDLSYTNEVGQVEFKILDANPADLVAGMKYIISLDVYNLGEVPVFNFFVVLKITFNRTYRENLASILVEETLDTGEYTNVQFEWKAVEGTHWLSAAIDYPDNLIDEMEDDVNNRCGFEVVVKKIDKIMDLNVTIEPDPVMPNREFIVSGTAKYNPEFNSLPVQNGGVEVQIVETQTKLNSKTDTDGKFKIKGIAPDLEGFYNINVKCLDGSINATKKDSLRVTNYQITATVTPSSPTGGKNITVIGNVTDMTFAVNNASVTINLLDQENNELLSTPISTNTNQNGNFIATFKIPVVTEKMEFTLEINASKDEIFKKEKIKFSVEKDSENDKMDGKEDQSDQLGIGFSDAILGVIAILIIIIIISLLLVRRRKMEKAGSKTSVKAKNKKNENYEESYENKKG